MTEEGKKWMKEVLLNSQARPPYGHMYNAMEFGIRAFCDEVGRRAVVEIHKCGFDTDTARWKALIEVKRELLGEEPK